MTKYLDLTIDTSTQENLESGCLEVLSKVMENWDMGQIKLKMFTDGLTNKLMGGWLEKEDMVLVRIYGEDTEKFIDRKKEMANMKMMAESGIGAQLFAYFNNGIVYQFVSGTVLTPDMLWKPEIYRSAATALAKMHRIHCAESSVEVWNFFSKLINHYPTRFEDSEKQRVFDKYLLTKAALQEEILFLQTKLADTGSPIVFCHNDPMPSNMILRDGRVTLIDLEYAAPNHAALDIAGVFNEYVGCEGDLDYVNCYPSEDIIRDWISTYLKEVKGSVNEVLLEETFNQVKLFSPCCQLVWSVWAVIQAVNSDIEFDFLNYARQRLEQYTILKYKLCK